MKNIGIITINIGDNYGNILQNYALSKFLINKGYTVSTIKYTPKYDLKLRYGFLKYIFMRIKSVFINHTPIKKHYVVKENRYMDERHNKFDNFRNKYIQYSQEQYNPESDFKNLDLVYDCYVIGSDQIWNPYWDGSNCFNFASFTKKRKIAYAPSIGVESIPKKQESFYKKMLENFHVLSCREKSGANELNRLTSKPVKVVLDPTLLLTELEWNRLIDDSNNKSVNDEYFLLYFLGEVPQNFNELLKTSNKYINISPSANTNVSPGPIEFLALIKNAKKIYTDSFHGTVFSIIFNKDFSIFSRLTEQKKESMDSRIDSLLEILELSHIKNKMDHETIDYSKVNKILELEREKSSLFLCEALIND